MKSAHTGPALRLKSKSSAGLPRTATGWIIETKKLGKWRRWLAKVYLPDSGKTLNEELIERGLARNVEE